jgi:hypothetical protein
LCHLLKLAWYRNLSNPSRGSVVYVNGQQANDWPTFKAWRTNGRFVPWPLSSRKQSIPKRKMSIPLLWLQCIFTFSILHCLVISLYKVVLFNLRAFSVLHQVFV